MAGSIEDLPPAKNSWHRCELCGREFEKKQGLSMHTTRVHGKKGKTGTDNSAYIDVGREVTSGKHREIAREVIWKKDSAPRDNPQEIQLTVDSSYQRPLDEGRVAEAHAQWQESISFQAATLAYLPQLSAEICRRGTKDELVQAFFLLYNDAEASK